MYPVELLDVTCLAIPRVAFPRTFFVLLLFILVVSNYWKSALILVHTWLLDVLKPNQQEQDEMALVEGSAAVWAVWCLSVDTLCCSSSCKQMEFTLELHYSYTGVKTEFKTRGRRRLSVQWSSIWPVLWGWPVQVAEAAAPIRAVRSRLGYSYGTCPNCCGTDHKATWGSSDPYV